MFQSSPGFEAGRYPGQDAPANADRLFQSSPGFEAGRYGFLSGGELSMHLFQSSPGFEAGRYIPHLHYSLRPRDKVPILARF